MPGIYNSLVSYSLTQNTGNHYEVYELGFI
ncbi:hypothetical protein S225a_08680 [Candidatus Brocadiaceae bacterium S225]|nr:hypothetical protein S225a_08680 [Candidatus Brocadiaceae bacterium S225]